MSRRAGIIGKRLILVLLPFLLLEIALRAAGIGGSIVYVEDDTCGYRPSPSQSFSTLGHRIEITAAGFRGPVQTGDVLCVGDSVTYGCAFIPDADTFPALLGAVNAGVNGWGLQNIERFLESADLSGYRTIIWTIPTADILRPFMRLRGGLISTNRRMLLRLEYLFRFVWYGKVVQQPDFEGDAAFEENLASVRRTRDRLAEKGIKLGVVLLPYREEAEGQAIAETPYIERFVAALEGADIPPLRAVPGGDLDNIYKDRCHLTSEGHAWLAGRIRERFLGQGGPGS